MAAKAQALGNLNWAPQQRELKLRLRGTLSKGILWLEEGIKEREIWRPSRNTQAGRAFPS